MANLIEAIFIFDQLKSVTHFGSENSNPIVQHVYCGRPPSAQAVKRALSNQPFPRSPVIYAADLGTSLACIEYDGLLYGSPISDEGRTVDVLSFLHQLATTLEHFLGSPVTASKIENHYHIVLQILGESCDGGLIHHSEPDVLRETVEVPGWMDKILGNVTLPGQQLPSLKSPSFAPSAVEHSFPWRRQNVRHTNNEVFVDILESLQITIAPSGLPIVARVQGLITLTSQLSGVPDLTVNLSVPGSLQKEPSALQLPSFHPCVRPAKWKERPGSLNFVPPDGKVELARYQVDLLPQSNYEINLNQNILRLPVQIDTRTGRGSDGTDFEVKVFFNQTLPGWTATPADKSATGVLSQAISSRFGPTSTGLNNSATPQLLNVEVTIPLPSGVENILEIRPSKGEVVYAPGDDRMTWLVPTSERLNGKTEMIQFVILRCIVASVREEESLTDNQPEMTNIIAGYEEYVIEPEPQFLIEQGVASIHGETKESHIKSGKRRKRRKRRPKDVTELSGDGLIRDAQTATSLDGSGGAAKKEQAVALMPTNVMVSFDVKGWLASGIKVDEIKINSQSSRAMGEGVKPYKGVRYRTVSKNGLEARC